jgi:hypothetical protein
MPIHLITTDDMHQKPVRVGSISVALLELTKAITFSSVMPNTTYIIFLQPTSNLGTTFWPTSPTTSGFTLNVASSVSGTIDYMAIAT